MNKKGFTLIETILVLVILALLLLIMVPNVMVMIDKNKIKSCHNLEDSIKNAAKIYVTNNKYELGFDCDTPKSITIKDLIESGDLKEGNMIHPVTEKGISDDTVVTVIYNCSNKTFSYGFDLNCEKRK